MPTFPALDPQGSHLYLFNLYLLIIILIISDNKHIVLFLDLLTQRVFAVFTDFPLWSVRISFLSQFLFSIFPELQFSVKTVFSVYTIMTVNIVNSWLCTMIICHDMDVCFLGINYFLSFPFLNFQCMHCLSVPNASTVWCLASIGPTSQTHQIFHQFLFSILETSLHSIPSFPWNLDSCSLAQPSC